MSIFKQGAFQTFANLTPAQIETKRQLMAAMMPKYGDAEYVGEGVGQLFSGIARGAAHRKLDKAESEGRKSAEEQFARLFGTANSAQSRDMGPLSVLGMAPSEPAPPTDPNSPGAIAGDAMAALGKQVFTPGDRDSFVNAMMPHALKVSEATGLDPRLVIAQAAQETGWGKSAPGNNFFGIKSHGKGGGNTFATNEVIDGQTVRINDSFRAYDSMGDSAMGYAEFLQQNPRYREMLSAGDLDGQIAALGRSGYATDPNYASSVRSIAMGIGLPEGFAGGQGNRTAPGTAAAAPTSAPAIPINELYMALQNPWLSTEQKGLITSMIQEQQQASDPLRQLELRKAEVELAQLENPDKTPEEFSTRMFTLNALQIDPQSEEGKVYLMTGKLPDASGGDVPAAFASLDMQAKAAGLVPGTPEYQTFMRSGGGAGAPAAFVALDLQAKAAGFEPGTQEYQEFMATRGAGLAAEATTRGKAAAEAEIAAPADIASAETTLGYITSLRDHPGRKAGSGASSLLGSIPGTSAKEFQIEVERLKAGAFLTAIDQLKGMGALSNAEGQTATAAVAALDPTGTEEGFLKRLAEYEEIVNRGLERARKRASPDAAATGGKRTLKWNPETESFE